MEGLGPFLGVEDADVGGQHGVEARTNVSVEWSRNGQEVDDLAQRVHAGVGPAAGVVVGRVAGQLRRWLFQDLLNGSQARLALPAVEVGAVVGRE